MGKQYPKPNTFGVRKEQYNMQTKLWEQMTQAQRGRRERQELVQKGTIQTLPAYGTRCLFVNTGEVLAFNSVYGHWEVVEKMTDLILGR